MGLDHSPSACRSSQHLCFPKKKRLIFRCPPTFSPWFLRVAGKKEEEQTIAKTPPLVLIPVISLAHPPKKKHGRLHLTSNPPPPLSRARSERPTAARAAREEQIDAAFRQEDVGRGQLASLLPQNEFPFLHYFSLFWGGLGFPFTRPNIFSFFAGQNIYIYIYILLGSPSSNQGWRCPRPSGTSGTRRLDAVGGAGGSVRFGAWGG